MLSVGDDSVGGQKVTHRMVRTEPAVRCRECSSGHINNTTLMDEAAKVSHHKHAAHTHQSAITHEDAVAVARADHRVRTCVSRVCRVQRTPIAPHHAVRPLDRVVHAAPPPRSARTACAAPTSRSHAMPEPAGTACRRTPSAHTSHQGGSHAWLAAARHFRVE